MPKFSVIVPVYKVEEYIDECIQSVIHQTFTDWELILVDDGSPDKCPKICDKYALYDNRISAVHKKNGGLSDARNAGLDVAKGEYVLFLDSDDYWGQSNALERINEKTIEDNSDIVIFGCTDFNDETGEKYVSRSNYQAETIQNKNKDISLHYLLSQKQLPGGSTVFAFRRRIQIENNIFFKVGIQDEDYDFVLSMFLNANNYSAIDDPFYFYRKNREGSITSTASVKMIYGIEYTINKWIPLSEKIESKIIRRDVLNYLSYIYCTGFVACGRMNKEDRKKGLTILKKHKSVLKYAYWRRPRMIRYILKITGFSFFSKAVTVYYDMLHHRREK